MKSVKNLNGHDDIASVSSEFSSLVSCLLIEVGKKIKIIAKII